ncbi:MAG TPA: aminoacyl-tRNA hydrolase [Candidatus Onthovivens sp.]|nr:aminoacyl-tRNA hydrolase [Candidatus Onthovivens sp.]
MKLIVGLGNIGKTYEKTRHNVGFEVIDAFADSIGEIIEKEGFNGLYCKCKYAGEDLILLKPSTFMNNSGISVKAAANFYKIDLEDIVIINDDLDIPVGKLKIKISGKSGGHNGLESIINHLGTVDFKRIKVGIGKPEYDVINYVLGKPSKEDRELINEAEVDAVDALKIYIKESFNKAMSIYNK